MRSRLKVILRLRPIPKVSRDSWIFLMEDPFPVKTSGSGVCSNLILGAWKAGTLAWVCKNYINICQSTLSLVDNVEILVRTHCDVI